MKQIVLGRHNSELRFELVKIAFEKTLEVQIQFADPNEMGRGIVALTDAVLTAMAKPVDADVETTATLADVRADMQDHLDSEMRRYAHDPTSDPYVRAYRDGVKAASANALGFINKAIGAAMVTELPAVESKDVRPTCRATLEFVRCSVQSYLDSKLYHWRRFPANQEEDVRGHRNGVRHACKDILKMIVAEMEKPEAETPDAE